MKCPVADVGGVLFNILAVPKHHDCVINLITVSFRFEIDDTSPSMSGCCGDEYSYEILSRRTKYGEASGHAHAGSHCGGCCH